MGASANLKGCLSWLRPYYLSIFISNHLMCWPNCYWQNQLNLHSGWCDWNDTIDTSIFTKHIDWENCTKSRQKNINLSISIKQHNGFAHGDHLSCSTITWLNQHTAMCGNVEHSLTQPSPTSTDISGQAGMACWQHAYHIYSPLL